MRLFPANMELRNYELFTEQKKRKHRKIKLRTLNTNDLK